MPFCGCLDDIVRGCENNLGGITNIFVAPWDAVGSITSTQSGEITNITMATCSFVEIEFTKNSSNYVEEAAIDLTNGSTYFTVTTNVMVPRRELAKRNAIALLAAGQQNLLVIIKDQNGLYWLQGQTNGTNLTGVAEGSGTAKADGSKYSLTFTSEEEEQMPTIDPAVITALFP